MRKVAYGLKVRERFRGFGPLTPRRRGLIVGALEGFIGRTRVGGDDGSRVDEKFVVDVFKGRGGFKSVRHHTGEDENIFADFDLVVQGIKEGFEVLWILVRINGYDDFEEHHLARTE